MTVTCDEKARCCADFYELPIVDTLLGDSFHPGGATLTRELANSALVSPGSQVLDIACGNGNSARLIAADFGARVTGCDYSTTNLDIANSVDCTSAVKARTEYVRCDAARLPFSPGSFDVAICECSLCLFEDRDAVLTQIHKVLRPGGRFGLSDFFINKPVPASLQGMLGTVLCIAGAPSRNGYRRLLENNGFGAVRVRDVTWAVTEMLQHVRRRLDLLIKTQDIAEWPDDWGDPLPALFDFERFVADGGAGYVIAVGHVQ